MRAGVLELKRAVRRVARTPAFAVSAVVSLALAVWLATSATALLLGVFWPKLKYVRPAEIVRLDETGLFPTNISRQAQISRPVLDELRATDLFTRVAEYQSQAISLQYDYEPSRSGYRISSGLLPLLGIVPALGRGFISSEDTAGFGNVAILSHDLWMTRFGGDSAVVGQLVKLKDGGPSLRIVGILPGGATFPPFFDPELYIPMGASVGRAHRWPTVIARLAPGVSASRAQAIATSIARRRVSGDRDLVRSLFLRGPVRVNLPSGPVAVAVSPYHGESTWIDYNLPIGRVMAIAVAIILVLACANVTNLLLIRAAARAGETALRAALGASAARLAGDTLADCVVVTLAATSLGTAAAFAQAIWLRSADTTFTSGLPIDSRAIAIAAMFGILLILGTGLLPSFRASRGDMTALMGRGTVARGGDRRTARLLDRIVTLSIGVTIALVILSGSLATVAIQQLRAPRGYDASAVLATKVRLREGVDTSALVIAASAQAALDRLRSLHGLEAVGFGNPPTQFGYHAISAAKDAGPLADLGYGNVEVVSRDYFRVLRIPFRAGMTFTESEERDKKSIVVNEFVARQLWPGRNAVGRIARLSFDHDSSATEYVVVGVVAGLPESGRADGARFLPQVYLPWNSRPAVLTTVLVRFVGDATARTADIRQVLTSVHADMQETSTLDQLRSIAEHRTRATALGFVIMGMVALLLTALSLYGVMAYAVSLRQRDLSIRIALGASPNRLRWALVRASASTFGLGLGLGVALVLIAHPLVRAAVAASTATNVSVYVGAVGITAVLGFIANYLPIRRALRVDPMTLLRSE